MEEGAWSDESHFFLDQVDKAVMLWAMFYWENLGPGIHVVVTLTHTTYRVLQITYTPSW